MDRLPSELLEAVHALAGPTSRLHEAVRGLRRPPQRRVVMALLGGGVAPRALELPLDEQLQVTRRWARVNPTSPCTLGLVVSTWLRVEEERPLLYERLLVEHCWYRVAAGRL